MKRSTIIGVSSFVVVFLGCILIVLLMHSSYSRVPDNEIWRITTLGRTNDLTVSNNTVLINSQNGPDGDCMCVYAVDKETGKIKWSTEKLAIPYISDFKRLNPTSSLYPGIFHIVSIDSKNKSVFVMIDSDLYMLDEDNGYVKWGPIAISTYEFPDFPDSDVFFIVDNNGSLAALEKSSGKEYWKTQTFMSGNDLHSWVFVFENKIFLQLGSEEENKLFAFDIQDGHLLWNTDLISSIYLHLQTENNLYLIFDNGFSDTIGGIIALDSTNGEKIWVKKFPENYSFYPTPSQISDDRIFVIEDNNSNQKLVVRNTLSGETLWEFNQSYAEGEITFYINDGVVYVGSETGYVFALNEKTGQEIWKVKNPAYPMCMTIENGLLIYNADNRYITAVDPKNGSQIWKNPTKVHSNGYFAECFADDDNIIIYDKKLFILDNTRSLQVVKLDTGKKLWFWKDLRYPDWRLFPIYKPSPEIGGIERNNIYIINSTNLKGYGVFALRDKSITILN